MAEPEAEVPPGLRLATAFHVLPGSLPRLRYGRKYWIRARVVDLAGNSLAPNPKDFGPESPSKNARTYFRYDPISAPAITLMKQKDGALKTPAEGESMEVMAVRTFNDTPLQNTIPATQHAPWHRAVAHDAAEAEQHGLLTSERLVDPASSPCSPRRTTRCRENDQDEGPARRDGCSQTAFAVWPNVRFPISPSRSRVTWRRGSSEHPDFPPKIIEIAARRRSGLTPHR